MENIKTAHYICDQCLKHEEIKYYDAFSFYDMNNTNPETCYNYRGPKFEIFCKRCDNFMFECDEMLVDIIIRLNRAGFYTAFCCEGHYVKQTDSETNDSYVSNPYIQFDSSVEKDLLDIDTAIYCALEDYTKLNKFEEDIVKLIKDGNPFIVFIGNELRVNGLIINHFFNDMETFDSNFSRIKHHFVEVCKILVDILEKMED